jgi:hypothetical protein
MLEHFNREMRLGGKIASGHFYASFGLHFQGTKDLASIVHLAYDGWFIKRYTVELEKYHGELYDHVKEAVPSSWDPEAVARLDPGIEYMFGICNSYVLLFFISHSPTIRTQVHMGGYSGQRFKL